MIDDLDEFLTGQLWDEDGDLKHDLPVDMGIADRMLFALRRLDQQATAIADQADARIAEITRWETERTEIIDRRKTGLLRALEGFARAINRNNPKAKTWIRPDGRMQLRPAQPKVEFSEPDEAVRWALTNGQYQMLTHLAPAASEFKKLTLKETTSSTHDQIVYDVVSDDGEIIPGVHVVKDRADRFSCSPKM